MVAFCFCFEGVAWVSAAGMPATSDGILPAVFISGEELNPSGLLVLSTAWSGRCWTADELLSRAMACGVWPAGSFEGVDLLDSVDDARLEVSTPRLLYVGVGAEVKRDRPGWSLSGHEVGALPPGEAGVAESGPEFEAADSQGT